MIFTPEEIASIMMNVLFVGAFLGIFFFTHVASVEHDIVIDQVDYIVADLTSDLKLLPQSTRDSLKQQLNSMQKPDLADADAKVTESNSKVMKKAVTVIVITLIIGLLIIFGMSRAYDFNIVDVLKQNAIILAFIALTEFTFLTFFASKFISADPNFVKLTILNKLSNAVPLDQANRIAGNFINNFMIRGSKGMNVLNSSKFANMLNNPDAVNILNRISG
jgi:hypothetical protein